MDFQHELDSRNDSNSYEETDRQNMNEAKDQSIYKKSSKMRSLVFFMSSRASQHTTEMTEKQQKLNKRRKSRRKRTKEESKWETETVT